MATTALAGLMSGFDWSSFIDTMIEAQSTPITRLQTEKTTNTRKINSLSSMSTKFSDLQTAANALKAEGLFSSRAAKSTTSGSTWTVGSSASTATGSYTFNVTQLATTARLTGKSGFSSSLASSSDVSGLTIASLPTGTAVTDGFFTVNGKQVTVASTDSLKDVFDRIASVTGNAVTASYDSATDKISLSSSSEIILGAANDSSNFLAVAKLQNTVGATSVSSKSSLGSAGLNTVLASSRLDTAVTAGDGSGNGAFTVNGVTINYNTGTDTINTIIGKINASTAGVTASYDPANDSLSLVNKSTGDIGISVADTSGDLLSSLGLVSGATLNRGKNASYTVNGGPALTSTTNTLDATSHGITGLSVTATTQTAETITVTSDTEKMKTAINTFVTKYNDLQTYIEDQTKITINKDKTVSSATLASNREVQSWASTLRSIAFGTLSGLTGSINDLGDLGISFTGTANTLSITDSTKLETALNNNPTDVEAFFKTNSSGFSAKLDSFAKTILGSSGTGAGGLLGAQTDLLTSQNSSIDTQIANIQRQLDATRESMKAAFIEMENAQATIKQQQSQLSQALGTSSSSSS